MFKNVKAFLFLEIFSLFDTKMNVDFYMQMTKTKLFMSKRFNPIELTRQTGVVVFGQFQSKMVTVIDIQSKKDKNDLGQWLELWVLWFFSFHPSLFYFSSENIVSVLCLFFSQSYLAVDSAVVLLLEIIIFGVSRFLWLISRIHCRLKILISLDKRMAKMLNTKSKKYSILQGVPV